MPDSPVITGIGSQSSLSPTDIIEVSQGANTRKGTLSQLFSSPLYLGETSTTGRSLNDILGDVVNVKNPPFNAVGDGVTDDTAAIQAAHDAATDGQTIYFPLSSGHYLYTVLTITKTITFQGAGWHCATLATFGDSGYISAATLSGSALRSTKTSAGASIVCTTIGKGPRFKNIAIVGPGSGTSTGISFGSAASYQILGKWDDVLFANFYIGVVLTNVEDYEFSSLRIRGCSTDGLLLQSGIAGTNTNQNTFIQLEIQKCGTALHATEASTALFCGGLIQGNTTGILLAPSGNARVSGLVIDSIWFETNTTNLKLDITSGGIFHLVLRGNNWAGSGDFFNLINPNNWTVEWLTLDGNSASGFDLNFAPGASGGPAYAYVDGGGNQFNSITRSNVQGWALFNKNTLTLDALLTTTPTTQTGATYSVAAADVSIIANRAGTVTLTLEAASTVPGKLLIVRTIQAQTVVSVSSNVVPLVGGAAGTAILAATAGKWALLQSDGAAWQIMAGN